MPTFTDTAGRVWRVELTPETVARVRADAGFDLMAVTRKPRALVPLARDPARLVAVLFAILAPQAEAAGVTPEAFAGALGGGARLPAAADALLAELGAKIKSGALG